jgi:hypothetical protein
VALIEVFRNEYQVVAMDPKGPLVRSQRSEIAFPSLEVLEQTVSELCNAFDEIGRENRVLLSDLRAVQGRNDEAFEDRMLKLRPKLYGGFLRVGILVRSSIGALQMKRLVREDGLDRMVMTDESGLLEYLLHG